MVRKVLTVFGVLGLLAAPAFADQNEQYKTEEKLPAAQSYKIRLDRSMFDQVGPRVDVQKLCGPAGASQVDNRRTASDVVLAFVSVGFYTPTHAKVQCNAPSENPSLSQQ